MNEVLESIAVGLQKDGDCYILLFVILRNEIILDEILKQHIKSHLSHKASPRHVPFKIFQVNAIPRTRSGKISEIIVSNIMNNQPITNKNALEDITTLQEYFDIYKSIKDVGYTNI